MAQTSIRTRNTNATAVALAAYATKAPPSMTKAATSVARLARCTFSPPARCPRLCARSLLLFSVEAAGVAPQPSGHPQGPFCGRPTRTVHPHGRSVVLGLLSGRACRARYRTLRPGGISGEPAPRWDHRGRGASTVVPLLPGARGRGRRQRARRTRRAMSSVRGPAPKSSAARWIRAATAPALRPPQRASTWARPSSSSSRRPTASLRSVMPSVTDSSRSPGYRLTVWAVKVRGRPSRRAAAAARRRAAAARPERAAPGRPARADEPGRCGPGQRAEQQRQRMPGRDQAQPDGGPAPAPSAPAKSAPSSSGREEPPRTVSSPCSRVMNRARGPSSRMSWFSRPPRRRRRGPRGPGCAARAGPGR